MLKKLIASTMLMPLLSIGLYATPALAGHWNNNDITVTNVNSAYVKNNVEVSASTGGNGGNGGDGGGILTGNAFAVSKIKNKVNTNVTSVDPCDCDVDDVTVSNNNSARVKNYVGVYAGTGSNNANGGSGSAAGNGGSVVHSDEDNTGGNGGNAGHGGNGGVIWTGDAFAKSKIFNKVNTNI